jgi:hypothetical protein
MYVSWIKINYKLFNIAGQGQILEFENCPNPLTFVSVQRLWKISNLGDANL